jgi:DNA-binding transcriptional MocR family regulator
LAIADIMAADIKAGRLVEGDRLPPQRQLASRLQINFTTVARGYVEAQKRGLIESKVGRGTIVRPTGRGAKSSTQPVDLTMNLPPEPSDPELLARMQSGFISVSRDLVALLRYQAFGGSPADKEAASAWLSRRALVPAQERVFVAPGAHAAIQGVLSLLARPGETILCEAITYPGVRAIAAQLGLNLLGLPMDEQGIDPDALASACRTSNPRALYINPTLQNPTTLTVPEERRLAIVAVARRFGLPILEDDAYGFIPPHGLPPLAMLAPDLTWHVAGLAKCIGAGLRAAFVVAPSARAGWPFVAALRAATVMASPLTLALATRWIEDGTADLILRFIRSEMAARQQLATSLLSNVTYRSAELAFNIWISLPPDWTRSAFIGQMRAMPIGIVPSDAFVVAGELGERVRVCLGGPIDRDGLRRALDFMAHLLAEPLSAAHDYV